MRYNEYTANRALAATAREPKGHRGSTAPRRALLPVPILIELAIVAAVVIAVAVLS